MGKFLKTLKPKHPEFMFFLNIDGFQRFLSGWWGGGGINNKTTNNAKQNGSLYSKAPITIAHRSVRG